MIYWRQNYKLVGYKKIKNAIAQSSIVCVNFLIFTDKANLLDLCAWHSRHAVQLPNQLIEKKDRTMSFVVPAIMDAFASTFKVVPHPYCENVLQATNNDIDKDVREKARQKIDRICVQHAAEA